MKAKHFFISLLILLPIALATTVQTSEVYAPDSQVAVTGTCDSPNILVGLEIGLGSPVKTIMVDQVTADADKQYTLSFTPPQKGTYTVYASCQGESSTSTTFCVGSDIECGVTPPGEEVTPPPSNGGGGAGGCVPQWDCTVWTVCNASLQQARTCYDKVGCQPTKIENRSCLPCVESWTCSLWSECQNGMQRRTCIDEHKCGTAARKPALKKLCEQLTAPGPQPFQISPQIPPPKLEPQVQLPASFWDKYKFYLIGIPLALILLAAVILLAVHFLKPGKKAYNFDELRGWIRKERQMGTSDQDIKKILSEQTGWSHEEITKAFSELKQGSAGTK